MRSGVEWRRKRRRAGRWGFREGGHEVGFGQFGVNGIRRGRERDICAG